MCGDDDFDKEVEQPDVKSLTEALEYREKLRKFAQFHGYQELALSVSKTNDLICDLKLHAPHRQTNIEEYFK